MENKTKEKEEKSEFLYEEAIIPPPPFSFEGVYVIKREIIDNPFTKPPQQFNYGKKVKHTENETKEKEEKSGLLSGGAIMPIKGVSVNPQLEQFLNQSCNKNGSVKDSESRDIKTQSHSSAESLYKEATTTPPPPCSFEGVYVIKREIKDNPFTKPPQQFNCRKKVEHMENETKEKEKKSESLSGGAIIPPLP